MSHTEVLTEDHRRQQFENRINVAFRHCRIGKVKLKKSGHVPDWYRKTIDRLCGKTIWHPSFPGVFDLPPMYSTRAA